MSRKLSFSMALAIVMVLLFAGLAVAQTPEAADAAPANAGCLRGLYVDADGDGLCDNYAYGPQWGAQPGPRMGMMQPHRNFVDEDGDGICDNCDGTGHAHHGMGSHMGGRFSRPQGRQGMPGMHEPGMGRQPMGRGWHR